MTRQDKIATLFGIGLNVVVVVIVFFGSIYYVA